MAAPLVADFGSFTLSGQATAPRLHADSGIFLLVGQEAGFTREATINLGDLDLKLDRLQISQSYFNDRGQPTPQMQRFWQRHCEAFETAFSALRDSVTAIQMAYDATAQAQTAATEANNAVAAVQETAAAATQLVEDLQSGELNLPAITIGGTRFGNKGDSLEPLE